MVRRRRQGVRTARVNIRKIIRKAGYKFYKARKVLTSTDPDYRKKLEQITGILSRLQADEKFFSIDEFGPFAVKTRGGVALAKPGQIRTVPQYQKSRGRLIVTGALELSTNQVTHFYSEKKNTDEMRRMLDLLLDKYRDQRRIYLSWDAASWHASKKFNKRVDEVHSASYRAEHGTPEVALAPLPSCAQFLNVIESIFSGMARATIHNSDYSSGEACKAAIDRYLLERNQHFSSITSPVRIGKLSWQPPLNGINGANPTPIQSHVRIRNVRCEHRIQNFMFTFCALVRVSQTEASYSGWACCSHVTGCH